MINFLSGTIIQNDAESITLLAGNVGYKVYTSQPSSFSQKQKIELWIHTHGSRDGVISLFGFKKEVEKEVFLLLLKVSGIGPKKALFITSVIPHTIFIDCITKKDSEGLQAASNINKKLADKIIIELDSKVSGGDNKESDIDAVAFIDTFIALGYTRAEARTAYQKVYHMKGDISEKIKEALKK